MWGLGLSTYHIRGLGLGREVEEMRLMMSWHLIARVHINRERERDTDCETMRDKVSE